MRGYVVDIVCPCFTQLNGVMPEVNFIGDLRTCLFDIWTIHGACYCMDNIQILYRHYSDIRIVHAQYEKETKLN